MGGASHTTSFRTPPVGGLIVCDGDSMTAGDYFPLGPSDPYPSVLGANLGAAWTVTNHGVDGRTLADMQANSASVDSQYNAANLSNWVVILGGTNDIFFGGGVTAAVVISRLLTYCNARQSVPFTRAVCTMLTRGSFDAQQEADRVTFNTEVRTHTSTYAERLVDLDADARLSSCFNTTYFLADQTHPTALGLAVIAELVQAQVLH